MPRDTILFDINETVLPRRAEIEEVIVSQLREIMADETTHERMRHLLRLNLEMAVESSSALRAIPMPDRVMRPLVRSVGEVVLGLGKLTEETRVVGASFRRLAQSIGQDESVEMVREKYDLPILILEGDQADAEGFSWEDAKNKIDGFVEVLEARKR